jgi:hypothetical protein
VTLGVAITSTIPVIFPALLLRLFGGHEDHGNINPFEPGVWAFPFLLINITVFSFAFLYAKNKLPTIISKSIQSFITFEISSQQTIILLGILLVAYIAFTAGDTFNDYYDADFIDHTKKYLENFSFTNFDSIYVQSSLQKISMIIFGSYKVLSFVSSVGLLAITYLLTRQITKKRFPGMISVAILLYSGIFLHYDDSAAYPNFWILFYLVSLYVIIRAEFLSPIFYVLGILSKSIVAVFLPMSLFFIYRSNITKKKKIAVAISYGVIAAIALSALFVLKDRPEEYDISEFSIHDFWSGFSAFNASFQHDTLVLFFLIPVLVGLYVVSNKVTHADSFMFLILGVLLSAPLMAAVSAIINTPYRFIPVIVFFAIGVGMLFSKHTE